MSRSGGDRAEVISSKRCSKLFVEVSSSFPSFRSPPQSMELTSPAASSSSMVPVPTLTPFSGLVICVTGLSKEARKQVMDATKRLGGQYSPNLHPQCTHLVVQSFHGRKLEHALKHGTRNGLFVVTLGWFVDSVRRNVRLSESLYSVRSIGENAIFMDNMNRLGHCDTIEKSRLPVFGSEYVKQSELIEEPRLRSSEKVTKRRGESTMFGHSLYVDVDISSELRSKVMEAASGEGASFVDQWFVGCGASHVVCEGPSVQKYIGHANNFVTPLWVLKSAKEKHMQRLVHMSADLARQVGSMLDNVQKGIDKQDVIGDGHPLDALVSRNNASYEDIQKIVNLAKNRVRQRRGRHMQACQTPIHPLTPSSLMGSICWSISEPTSTASIYRDSVTVEDAIEHNSSVVSDVKVDETQCEAAFLNLSRPLTESEKTEVIFKNHFLTILFPIDRFAEIGPCSKTFYSDTGFTCMQVLDHIYIFYQENMSAHEIEVAIHTDSRHADRLRSVYSSEETAVQGYVSFKRIDFMGSRKSFEMLKRVTGDNNSNVYELLIRA